MSRLIKSRYSIPDHAKQKVISIKHLDSVDPNFEQSREVTQAEYNKMLEIAHQEAETIRMQAIEEAERIRVQLSSEKQNWDIEKVNLIEEAKANGFQIGFEEGKHVGYNEASQYIQQARDTVNASKMDYGKYLQSAESTILELAIEVAEKIINDKIKEDEQNFLSVVQNALKEVRKQREIQLHVPPIYYELVLAEKEELLQLFPIKPSLFVFPDESLEENGCIIETANGRLDASIDTQLFMIKEKLLEVLESEEG
ncbi:MULTISPECIES: flagellar assembly protein FliH [Niallia]|uniref:Flagellar assembly protein FliH n=1 Tax=Niallia alba TaxID=2729105 RepID=A0A7Y0PNC3_9BACI|nr:MULTISPECIES: flagellar assembly protein FliH [Niallia]NMO77344.1 flagellar assembly protein FliH [Niallia alba]UTI40552.1 flagellar assembly protein FliH [Niallia sp. RD1]